MTLGFKFKFYYNVLKTIQLYWLTLSRGGGGVLLNNLKTGYIRKLKLLHFFNIIVVKNIAEIFFYA